MSVCQCLMQQTNSNRVLSQASALHPSLSLSPHPHLYASHLIHPPPPPPSWVAMSQQNPWVCLQHFSGLSTTIFTLNFKCRAQKTSLWAWALGSVCTIVSECYELSQLSKPPSTKEGEEAWEIKRMKAQAEINSRMNVLIHALFQVSGACTCKELYAYIVATQ